MLTSVTLFLVVLIWNIWNPLSNTSLDGITTDQVLPSPNTWNLIPAPFLNLCTNSGLAVFIVPILHSVPLGISISIVITSFKRLSMVSLPKEALAVVAFVKAGVAPAEPVTQFKACKFIKLIPAGD